MLHGLLKQLRMKREDDEQAAVNLGEGSFGILQTFEAFKYEVCKRRTGFHPAFTPRPQERAWCEFLMSRHYYYRQC